MRYIVQDHDLSVHKMEDCPDDYGLLAKWRSNPALQEYYGGRNNPYDLEKVIQKYGPRTRGEDPVVPCIVEYGGQSIGYVQYFRIDSVAYPLPGTIDRKDYAAPYGLDLFIGDPEYLNRSIGTRLVQSMIRYLFDVENADGIFIEPQTWNKRAIRCYEKSGFKPLALMEKRELHEGEYKDCLLMGISGKH